MSITKRSILQTSYSEEAGLFLWNLHLEENSKWRHNPPFTVESTTKVKTGLRHIQILRFGSWKRKHTNIRGSDSNHKVAQRLKKVGCSPQLSDLSLKTNSSNYNSKVQLLNHNYCWGGGKNELFMSHMPYTFWGWKRQICRKRANRPLYGHKVCHPLFPAATRMRFFPFQAPSKWWASPLRTSPCSPEFRCLTAIGQSCPQVTIKTPTTRVGVQRGAPYKKGLTSFCTCFWYSVPIAGRPGWLELFRKIPTTFLSGITFTSFSSGGCNS